MRTLEEVQRELDEVEAQIKAQQEGMPNYGDPGYRAARFDYIVEGDRTGLDAYQNALNSAIQNKLSRESAENMAKAGKEQADEEAMDQWQKEYSFAKSAQSEIYNNPASTQKQKDDADANVRYYESVGKRKGYLDKYKAMTAAPVEAAVVETQKQDAPKETFKQLMARGQTLEKDEDIDAWTDDVKKYTGNDAVVGEAYEGIAKGQEKKKANAEARWKEFNSRVTAARKEANYNKRKELLEPLKEELSKYKGQEKYAEVEKSINDGLKKPAPDPLTKGVVRQNFGDNDVRLIRNELEKGKVKEIERNIPVGGKGRTVKFRLLKNRDVQVVNEKGKEIDLFPNDALSENNASRSTSIKKENPIATLLKGNTKFPNGRIIVPEED